MKRKDDGWGDDSQPNQDDGWGTDTAQNNDGGWGADTNKSQDDGWGDPPVKSKDDGGWGDPPASDNNSHRGGGGRGGRGGGGGGCFNCGESGHLSRECSAPRKQGGRGGGGGGGGSGCFNCGESGHLSRECSAPRKQGGGGGGGGGGGCFNCGESGHLSRECSAPRKQGGGGGGGGSGCFNCGESGHLSRECSAPRKQGGGGGFGDRNNDKRSSYADNDRENDRGDNKRLKTDQDTDRPAPYKPEELNLDEETKLQGSGAGENFKKYNEQLVVCFPKDIIKPVEKFEDIVTSDLLMDNIKSQRYTEMTPVQKWAMPAIRDGHDLISCAQTGSGKTAAFLLPVLQNLLKTDLEPHDPNSDRQDPYCLIISPTRELANQIYLHANMLSKDSKIKCQVIYGQISTAHLKSKLSTGCHILVATPGRLKDFVNRNWIGFKNIKYIILDEGDRLVDEGFTSDIKEFFEHSTMSPRESRQTLFFSATFKQETQLNARKYLKENFAFLTVGRVGAANEDIKQEFLQVSRQEKKRELKNILSGLNDDEKTIIFTQTKVAADMLAGFFTALNLSSTSIHGDRHQSQREQAIKSFRRGEKRFLISSPVGNRGLDLPKVALVINYDLPSSIDEYVHRIGRTGRAGHTGRAISFYDAERDAEVLPDLIEILKEAKQEIPDWMQGGSGSSGVTTAAGEDDWETGIPSTNTNNGVSASSQDDWENPPKSSDPKPTQTASNGDDWDDVPPPKEPNDKPASEDWEAPAQSTSQKAPPAAVEEDDEW